MESEEFMAGVESWRRCWEKLSHEERNEIVKEIIVRNVVDSFAFEGEHVDPEFLKRHYDAL